MSISWSKRKARLDSLLKSNGDEDEDALALDRLLHGQTVIGKTSKTTEIDTLRFTDRDLGVVGTLEFGQFGVIDVVNCHLDGRVYVRKSIEKRFALKTRDQCSPQTERDILLYATKRNSQWAPHLLCAFQTSTHLSLVMDYAEGGTLWDVLESSPYDGKVPESDLRWWTPQIVSAIHWCHSQGFVHRDVKPHNFVLSSTAHILLIDFGSAAPLLPPRSDGSQLVPKKYCLVPCGTCDYISPEILQAHEEALVALEMDEVEAGNNSEIGGYGLETDWWSLGAMLYEMAYGVAPFFANDIRQTYIKIMDHQGSLRFNKSVDVSSVYQDLVRRLLMNHEERLGRINIAEITEHPFFAGIEWPFLRSKLAPSELHLPQFTYSTPKSSPGFVPPIFDESHSQPFAFSALFQSSKDYSSPGVSALHSTPTQSFRRSAMREQGVASFIGFSWGPKRDAFPDSNLHSSRNTHISTTPGPAFATPRPLNWIPSTPHTLLPPAQNTPALHKYPFATPVRPSALSPYQTLPRTSTIRRTAPRRTVSDREAMKQLVDCIGMSARKKVLASGRKPRVLTLTIPNSTLRKELRFDPTPTTSFSQWVDAAPQAESESGSEGPPSPSPSPRPGSAMSFMSRRSQTPTISASYSRGVGVASTMSANTMLLGLPQTPSWAWPNRLTCQLQVEEEKSSRVLCFDSETLEGFEDKYGSLMEDIGGIQRRLDRLLIQLDSRG